VKVAYVLEEYPELSQTFVETELREVREQGDEPRVLALRPGPQARLAEAGFEPSYPMRGLRRIRAFAARPGAARHGVPWPSDGKRLRGAARIAGWVPAADAVEHLHAHFATEAADVAAILGRLTGTPHSFTGHSTDLFADPGALRRRLEAASFVAVVCEYDCREVDRIAPGHSGRVEVVPVGLDLQTLRRTTPYDPDGPVVAVGRLVEQKGFGDLVAVAGDVGREVVIAGDGPLRESLSSSPAVRMPGAVSPAEALRYIEGASVLVAPSVIAADGSRDGIPTVLKEALALGTPVVASDAVGNPEVVRPAHGVLYPAGDRAKLLAAVRGLLARDDREAMGRAGRSFAEQEADVRVTAGRLRELWRAARDAGSSSGRR
jgi:glycosyltransferase involved in cell wall biosynthesis